MSKKWLLILCLLSFLCGCLGWYFFNASHGETVRAATDETNQNITDGKRELDEAYKRVEELTRTTVSKTETVRQEVRSRVEAMDDDSLVRAFEFELQLFRSGDKGAEGLDSARNGVLSDGTGRAGNGKRIARASVNSGDLGGGLQ